MRLPISSKNILRIDIYGTFIVGLLILASNYMVFLVVPNERIMGAVQRIFYFHVGSAIATYCACLVILIASLFVLANRSKIADAFAEAAGEVGLLFATIVLVTGMIWGHSAWNTWFRWEPRLVTFLLLWLILLGFNLLRYFGDPVRIANHSAVLGVISAITVPIVVYSIKIWPHLVQLHPVVVENQGLVHPLFRQAFLLTMVSLISLQFLLVWFRARISIVQIQS